MFFNRCTMIVIKIFAVIVCAVYVIELVRGLKKLV